MSLIRSTLNVLTFGAKQTIGRFVACPILDQRRYVKRWVAPTLRELRRRERLLGPQEPQPRSGFIEWNYEAELFAFSKRLHEEFQLPLLQTAFTQRAYCLKEKKRQMELDIEEVDIKMEDNEVLASEGAQLVKDYVQAYLEYSLPKCPIEGRREFAAFLLSENTLAHIGTHLGMKELLYDVEYPPSNASLAKSTLAVIGALAESSSVDRAFLFIRDFICTQLNQKDLLELWHIEDAETVLKTVCKERKLGEPEPRLLGDCGADTLLAAFHVGIYIDKQLIGKGFGEDVTVAIKTASLNALQILFGIQDHMRPFNFQLQIEPKANEITS